MASRRPRGLVIAGLALGALLAGLGAAGCGSDDETTTTTTAQHQGQANGISASEKQAATRRLQRELGVGKGGVKKLKHGRGLPATSIQPAEIVPGGPGPFFSSDTIYPVTNGWQAGDHRSYTAVDAGANPANPTMGELGVFRQDHVSVTQSQKVVNVPGAGTIRIVRAPEGTAAATSAQRTGELEFVGSRGVRGTLHLSDNSVTIERKGASQAS
jgi:hypothetical protein